MGKQIRCFMKKVICYLGILTGWLAFVLGFMADSSVVTLLLLSIARALP